MTDEDMRNLLECQRAAFESSRPEPLSTRIARLNSLNAMLRGHVDDLADAMAQDFGARHRDFSVMVDILPVLGQIDQALAHLKRWVRPERRRTMFPLGLLGARAEVRYEPKGVIGIVSPWNYPVSLCLTPLAQALAAGNRAMIKPSEATPQTSRLLRELIAEAFPADEVTVVTGDAGVGQAFCRLPFDHLFFTGSTAIGRKVMAAASENLTPVTLELGGKSPVIVGGEANLDRAAERIVLGKMMNAGQTCVAPDYVMVHQNDRDALVQRIVSAAGRMYPNLADNPDHAAIIDTRHQRRLRTLLADAEEKGARLIALDPAFEAQTSDAMRKAPLVLVLDATREMLVMQEEIFGPILPVLPYSAIDDAIDFVNRGDRPLALYFFGEDAAEREQVLGRTLSGGVTVNDTIFHVSQDNLPFGGIGPSGMGAYHGVEGFRTFSHARAVYHQPRWPIAALAGLRPPYGRAARRYLRMRLSFSLRHWERN